MWKFKPKGAEIPKYKDHTKNLPIERADSPAQVVIPLGMHIGKPAKAVVDEKDKVKKGSVIGEAEDGVSTNVHATISGTVIAIEERNTFRGEQLCVIIENDGTGEEKTLDPLESIDEETFSARLEEAGITGKGGAGFPTALKYKTEAKKVGYLVVNGTECEPYSTTDYRVMLEYTEEILAMIAKIMDVYTLEEAHIAVEDHMDDVIARFEQFIQEKEYASIYVSILPSTYPQGHAGLQIRQVLGIEIETGQRSGDVGVLQSNVSTIKAMYDAIFSNRPFTERVITVTGPRLSSPKNLLVPLGVSVQSLLDQCGGLTGEYTLINGGPMMGKAFENLDIPVDKDTTTITALDKIEEPARSACIRCAKCIENCPVRIQPIHISNAYENGEYEKAVSLKSDICISCGVCTFSCPARIPLLDNIQKLNEKWKEMQDAKE